MRQVKINTLNMRIFGSDQFEIDPKTTSNVYQSIDVLKTFVKFKNPLHNYSGGVEHSFVENLIEPGIHTRILKGMHAMNPVECYASFQNRSFQFGPESMQTIRC